MHINHTHIQELVDHIEANLADEVNVLQLADAFHMSPWHFQRTFKSLVGDTLGAYIRGRRLSRAAQLLVDTDKSVIDIAFEVGFNSHEAFSRSFKSYFHTPPKRFRKEQPSVLLAEKPLLTTELYEHLSKGMQQQPQIVQRSAQRLIGMQASVPSPFVANENYCDLLYTPWMTLLDRQEEIATRTPGTYYGLTVSPSGNFTEDRLSYIAGVPVATQTHVPVDMVAHGFPEQLVAMFDVFAGTADTLAKTVDYIYGYWLPNSAYTRGNGNDYELFENVTSFDDPALQAKYVVPIVPKK